MPAPKTKSHSFVPDDRQREAIEHVAGPMLVVAGAGTGKTSVLIHRVANLVKQGNAKPEEILALTYTVAAAREMKERAAALLGEEIQSLTFHDYCNGLLKRAKKDFGVLDEKDLWIYLRKRIHELHLEHYVRAANVGQFLGDLTGFLCRCHDELVTPEKYAAYVARLESGEFSVSRVSKSKDQLSEEEIFGRCREIAQVFSTTERWLREENYGTFSHMITRAHELLTRDADCLSAERARARFILVDEFQDANFAQIKILVALAGAEANIFAVGDPDQAIYRFRGASSAAFQLFRRHFPQTKLVVLGKNRRSTTPILQCAFAVIDKNPPVFAADSGGLGYRRSPLQSAREEDAKKLAVPLAMHPVEAISFAGKTAEAPDVAHTIEEAKRRLRCHWKDFAVLYRTHPHRDEIVQELAEREIPFSIENMDVSDTPEVRDLFACVAAVVDLSSDANLFRVAALPQFNVDPEQLRTALRAIDKDSKDGVVVPLASVLSDVNGGKIVLETVYAARQEVSRKNLKTRAALQSIGEMFRLGLNSVVLQAALKFASDWEQKPTTKTGELGEWVEYLEYFREASGTIPLMTNGDEDAVRLMTTHGAKGLEFSHVFVLRATSGSFPLSYRETLVEFPRELRDPDSASAGDDKTLNEQEERRLFYVAMTRARDSLRIYGKQGIGKDKTPAGLMRELLGNAALQPWLRSRTALPFQPELIEIAAASDEAHPGGSRLPMWLALPHIDGLGARLSATAVETYERCPLQFKFEREWKLSREIHAAMQYGAAMHRVLRTYYDSVRLGRTKTDDELLQLFSDDLTSSGIQDDYQCGLYMQQGLEQLKDFLAGVRSGAPKEILHTEEWFDAEIAGTKVAGRIDRMDRVADGSVAIVDYKTGKARSQEDADESLQLSIYAMAAQQKWGYRVGELIFHNLEGNVAITSRRDDFQLERARERVQAVARGIAEGNFDAEPGFHCTFCAFRGLCPAREKRAPKT
ncbi:MAG TPA: ATP-dependent DNA helicase [Candidatus Aquilonibacter sp.]|jgi:DNA helicase-2/ATP-dependent DNA helicase PcrA|nr:ATP-dependent DNA helicase [Candidatus Aquilonibacter sp.]